MSERSGMIEWIRGEMVGPSRPLAEVAVITFVGGEFVDPVAQRRGPLAWHPTPDAPLEEVLYYDRESPHRKYGTGLLHPGASLNAPGVVAPPPADETALHVTDTLGVEAEADEGAEDGEVRGDGNTAEDSGSSETADDFEVTSPDVRQPSTIGISFCVRLAADGQIVVRLPQSRRFAWQPADTTTPFALNGRYESGKRRWTDDQGRTKDGPVWRRRPAVLPDTAITFRRTDFVSGSFLRQDVVMPEAAPIRLRIEVLTRQCRNEKGVPLDDLWLLTLVLRNSTRPEGEREPRESVLYQTYFEVAAEGGRIERYPESRRPFDQLDPEEQSLALLYRESATWGIGHGCAAGWDTGPGEAPTSIYADVMPAVELPSMTPDIEDAHGNRIQLSMRSLADLTDGGDGPAWQSLENLATEYAAWIQRARDQMGGLDGRFAPVAKRHLDACTVCLTRINDGIALLRNNASVRRAFRLANLAMLLQQITTKQLVRRPLKWDEHLRRVGPSGDPRSPWSIFEGGLEDSGRLGSWRAFQIAFLLMSLDGVRSGVSRIASWWISSGFPPAVAKPRLTSL